ncbi:MAG: chromosomal replication initiator protein DnaA [Dehalococcoidia bacterium]|nr:chromosomal replication initiator protein DnaA [Dehalococcoidia bacterium]
MGLIGPQISAKLATELLLEICGAGTIIKLFIPLARVQWFAAAAGFSAYLSNAACLFGERSSRGSPKRMNSAKEIWEAALGELQLQVNKSNYKTFFKGTEGLAYDGDRFLIGVSNTFVSEYLEKNQRSLIEKTLLGLMHRGVNVRFQIKWAQETAPDCKSEVRRNNSALYGFNPKYTFDNFIIGTGNRMAHAAALSAAERPSEQSYNPLFIYSAPGLGKTHLVQSIGHKALENNLCPVYVSGEQFTNEFVAALRERRTEEFRAKYRSADILIVDDIHFIGGKEATEESFFHTFNDLHNAGRQIVITSDRPPKSMPLLQERLRSRFEWGLAVDIQPPDFESRLAILQSKAQQAQADVSPDVLDMVAQELRKSIRELEGSLNRIIAYARLLHTHVTPELAARALKDLAGTRALPEVPSSSQGIIGLVAETFDLTADDLLGRGRCKEVAQARQVAMYVMRQQSNCSFSDIGMAFGGRNASTVSHACEKVSQDVENSYMLRRKVDDVCKKLSSES